MWSLDSRARAALAVVALASLGGIASVAAHGEEARERHEQRPSERERRPAVQPSRRTYPGRIEGVHGVAGREPSYAHGHPVASYHRETGSRNLVERRPTDGNVSHESHLAAGGQVHEVTRGFAGGQVHVFHYGSRVSGSFERTIRPGLVSRTFVSGGHVLYTRVYQHHVWHQFGRAFAYETFVPAVRYPTVYYSWALATWPRPVTYAWGWRAQAWYPQYGVLFTPYPVYTSPDLWMTDYIIAQSMQTAYAGQTSGPVSGTSPAEAPVPPPQEYMGAAPADPSGDSASAPQPSDAPPPPQPSAAPTAPQASAAPAAPVAMPPAITPQVKAQLNAQIKVQLREQQDAAAMPATLTTQSTPPALRPNHVFFQVVQPLDVPSGAGNHSCSLSANDYIKRTGGMSSDDWMIPVVVELSGPSDCPEGLQTRIGLNDLNAMENEQEAQVMQAMQAASKSMGPNGPPSGPGVHPTLIADGSAAADPGALDAIRQAQ